MFTRILRRTDFTFDTTLTKTTGNEDGIGITQDFQRGLIVGFEPLGIEVVNFDLGVGLDTGVSQGLVE